ncbi:MAG: hypothetical protein EPN33_02645 [Acidobacteria bacterium]|nr:MAG: hypothetical protein EPN33_02645 [Acidobacteriota bacterium]
MLQLSLQAARFYLRLAPKPEPAAWEEAVNSLPPRSTVVRLATLEGLRFYALDPASYTIAAWQWLSEQTAGASAWVVGLRSMGSVLAPVVAAALADRGCSIRLLTLRPVGAPEQRQIRLEPVMQQQFARWPGTFLIVDEGPGLSGSSFGGTVAALRRLGIPQARIVLLPSWSPTPEALGNAYAAQHWERWRAYPAPALPAPGPDAVDLSGGLWRQRMGIHRSVPVWPTHERRKLLCGRGRILVKFGGLGRYGCATQVRAQELARAGWGPELAGGDLDPCWVSYRRMRAAAVTQPGMAWCRFAGRYLAWVASTYRIGVSAAPSVELQEMLTANLGKPVDAPEGPVVALDGRMLACEWGETAQGFVKFDGTDHGDDPFFPGPADIAWDLAAVDVEFGPTRGRAVIETYRRVSGETLRALVPRLRWHRLAYLAFRMAYCRLAATQTPAPDSARFARLAEGYTRLTFCPGRSRWSLGSPRVIDSDRSSGKPLPADRTG